MIIIWRCRWWPWLKWWWHYKIVGDIWMLTPPKVPPFAKSRSAQLARSINWKSIPEISNLSINTHPSELNFKMFNYQISAENLCVLKMNVLVMIFVGNRVRGMNLRQEPIYMSFESRSGCSKDMYWEIWYSMKWEQLVYSQDYPAWGKFHSSHQIYDNIHLN